MLFFLLSLILHFIDFHESIHRPRNQSPWVLERVIGVRLLLIQEWLSELLARWWPHWNIQRVWNRWLNDGLIIDWLLLDRIRETRLCQGRTEHLLRHDISRWVLDHDLIRNILQIAWLLMLSLSQRVGWTRRLYKRLLHGHWHLGVKCLRVIVVWCHNHLTVFNKRTLFETISFSFHIVDLWWRPMNASASAIWTSYISDVLPGLKVIVGFRID